MSLSSRFIRILIRFYQYAISPWLGSPCRFTPTCSCYAMEAVEKYGAVKGSILTTKRLMKCHPFGGHGYDPVPTRKPRIKHP